MNAKKLCRTIALCLLAAVLAGCGLNTRPDETTSGTQAAASLELSDVNLSSTTWSSPNGATIGLTATPVDYVSGQAATFLVRLEGEEVASQPCQWNGSAYTAFVDLNAADGYCYYVLLENPDGASNEITVNSPTSVISEPLINLADALNAYCAAFVTDSAFSEGTLTLLEGSAQVQTPRILNGDQPVTCLSAQLILSIDGQELAREDLSLVSGAGDGQWTQNLEGICFTLPELEDDQQAELLFEVTLTNGQILTSPVSTWLCIDGQLLSAVG